MLKKMQRRFIMAAMAAFATVMLVLVVGINIVNYYRTTATQDDLAASLLEYEKRAYEHRTRRKFSSDAQSKEMISGFRRIRDRIFFKFLKCPEVARKRASPLVFLLCTVTTPGKLKSFQEIISIRLTRRPPKRIQRQCSGRTKRKDITEITAIR